LGAKYDVGQIGHRGIGRGINLYSFEREKTLGDKLAAKLDHSLTIIDDPLIYRCLNRIVQVLVSHSEVPYEITVKLVYDDDEVNAYSLPGGHLYMTSGLFVEVQTEAEMAMVMAHEIAHVAARHDTRTWTREILWDLPFFPILKVPGPIGYSAQQITSALRSLPVMKFNRNAEHEADLLGLEYAYSAGYDPQGMLDLYERSVVDDAHAPNFIVRLFDTHPSMKERLRRAKTETSMILPPRNAYVLDTSEFQEARHRLMDIVLEKQRAEEAAATSEVKPEAGSESGVGKDQLPTP
jgi:predicted Zn-dependent protease